LAGWLLAAPLQAGPVVYSQPPVNGAVSFFSDFAEGQQIADDFVLGQTHVIADVHWWGSYLNDGIQPDDFTLRFFIDAGGVPATNPLVSVAPVNLTRTPTGLVDLTGIIHRRFRQGQPTNWSRETGSDKAVNRPCGRTAPLPPVTFSCCPALHPVQKWATAGR
jgi:hypothetical protein